MPSTLRLLILAGASIVLIGFVWTRGMDRLEREPEEISVEHLVSMVVSTVVPVYPRTSLQQGSNGVAVARVSVNPSGRVSRAEVLEAPDAAIAASVQDALLRWRFPTRPPKDRRDVRGRVIWYFVIEGRQGLVLTPAEMATRRIGKVLTGPPSHPPSQP